MKDRSERPDPETPRLRVDAARLGVGDAEVAYIAFDHRDARELPGLTPAEASVVQLVVAGLSNNEIARARGVSPRTVANQLSRVFERLGVSSRHELVAWVSAEP